MIDRVILVVMDSVGIGELPDADLYGDKGSNTLVNILKKMPNLSLDHLTSLGLGNIDGLNISKVDNPKGAYGKALELSPGKDTTTGHWEIAGITLKQAFPTYPHAFPQSFIEQFERAIGRPTIANEVASGTEIISRLGDEHVKTGYPIVYTSADSVFQIAAHEEVIPLEKLYEMCSIARKMLTGEHAVGRVIARPFLGTSGNYKRTSNRRDFSLLPISKTMLDVIKESNLSVMAVGKIEDIFAGVGITDAVHTKSNMDGVEKTLEYMKTGKKGLIFTNLVDFDMTYGHRNDVEGYGNALKEFDNRLPEIMESMKDTDVLIITADHGCDPTTASTDHSREYIPLLVYGKKIKPGVNLGIRKGFSDIAATVLDLLELPVMTGGKSFKEEIL
ncbi:MAG: phosphopentomutase [Clostridia bacterium]|jgi:phosphopentomutase|nr:phosphopentomutase [Clostridia bacterium]